MQKGFKYVDTFRPARQTLYNVGNKGLMLLVLESLGRFPGVPHVPRDSLYDAADWAVFSWLWQPLTSVSARGRRIYRNEKLLTKDTETYF